MTSRILVCFSLIFNLTSFASTCNLNQIILWYPIQTQHHRNLPPLFIIINPSCISPPSLVYVYLENQSLIITIWMTTVFYAPKNWQQFNCRRLLQGLRFKTVSCFHDILFNRTTMFLFAWAIKVSHTHTHTVNFWFPSKQKVTQQRYVFLTLNLAISMCL